MANDLTYDAVVAALSAAGFAPRGGFYSRAGDVFGDNINHPVGTVVLAGNVGSNIWPWFTRERRDEENPLDAWSKRP